MWTTLQTTDGTTARATMHSRKRGAAGSPRNTKPKRARSLYSGARDSDGVLNMKLVLPMLLRGSMMDRIQAVIQFFGNPMAARHTPRRWDTGASSLARGGTPFSPLCIVMKYMSTQVQVQPIPPSLDMTAAETAHAVYLLQGVGALLDIMCDDDHCACPKPADGHTYTLFSREDAAMLSSVGVTDSRTDDIHSLVFAPTPRVGSIRSSNSRVASGPGYNVMHVVTHSTNGGAGHVTHSDQSADLDPFMGMLDGPWHVHGCRITVEGPVVVPIQEANIISDALLAAGRNGLEWLSLVGACDSDYAEPRAYQKPLVSLDVIANLCECQLTTLELQLSQDYLFAELAHAAARGGISHVKRLSLVMEGCDLWTNGTDMTGFPSQLALIIRNSSLTALKLYVFNAQMHLDPFLILRSVCDGKDIKLLAIGRCPLVLVVELLVSVVRQGASHELFKFLTQLDRLHIKFVAMAAPVPVEDINLLTSAIATTCNTTLTLESC